MKPERELERHNRILEQIKDAKTKAELPEIGFSDISSFLANNVYFNNQKTNQSQFKGIVYEIIEMGTFSNPIVRNDFVDFVCEIYPNVNRNTIITKYNEILKMGRIDYILEEMAIKNQKADRFTKETNKKVHNETMTKILTSHSIDDLPKVGLSDLNKKILRCFNNNDYIDTFKTRDLTALTRAYLNKSSITESIVDLILFDYDINDEDRKTMTQQIVANLAMDETIEYTAEEILAIEQRKLVIYRLDHEDTMENIKNAKRISQLPPKLSVSTLNKYLLGNATIYPNNNLIDSEDLKPLVDLLMSGKKWEDDEVKDLVHEIAYEKYPYMPTAGVRLYDKLSTLPRTYYLVEEINYNEERKNEFIELYKTIVHYYQVRDFESSEKGGNFYRAYTNETEQIDLDPILASGINIKELETYIRENIDDTFKAVGGLILEKDKILGSVSIYNVGISPKDKAKLDKITNLDEEIIKKQQLVEALDIVIANKQQTSSELESKIKIALINYERTVLEAQKSLATHMEQLKQEFGIKKIEGPTYNKKN